MSLITDGINKIKNLIFKNRDVKTIREGNRDLILVSKLNTNSMKYFENPNNYNDYCKSFWEQTRSFNNQLDYAQVLTQMQENGCFEEYNAYLKTVEQNSNLYYPSEVHGIDHTKRVLLFAEMLCMIDEISPHDRNLILTAAQLHDIGRDDDKKNIEHGLAGKNKIENLRLLRNFPERDADIIKFAVECHSLSKQEVKAKLKNLGKKDRADYKRILDYLQDADKLDRTRISQKEWGLDPNRLTTNTAKKLIKIAHQNYYEYENVMSYEEKRNATDLFGNKLMQYFEIIRQNGYNISFDDFNNIISEYQPGVIEAFAENGRLTEIFSLDVFLKYRKEENFQERISPTRIDPELMFQEITQKEQTALLRTTYEEDFMIYYNLKKQNPDGFELLCYVDLDPSDRELVGLANEIKISDLELLYQKGCKFRLNDLFLLASKFTPEQYHDIIQNGNIEDLYNIKSEKNANNILQVKETLKNKGISIDNEIFEKYYGLIKIIVDYKPDVFKESEINNYTIPEIFAIVTKLNDAKYEIHDRNQLLNYNFEYNSKTVIELLKYSKNTKILEQVPEDIQLDVVTTFVTNENLAQNPRFIEYVLKKNKPYLTNNVNDILNYPEYCSTMILCDNRISLKDAKSNFINALFNIDVPKEYKMDFEKEMMDTLYYYQKYLPQSSLQKQCGNFVEVINQILDTKNINEFKQLLYRNMKLVNSFNTNQIGEVIKQELMDYSKTDMVQKLQQTHVMIENLPSLEVLSENGRPVKAKILTGQKYYIAQSTAMPQCSYYTGKIKRENPGKQEQKIGEAILKANVFRPETCNTIISDEMVAHAGSAFGDQEVKYAYFPKSKEDISISAMYDLSSKKANGKLRVTQKPTTYRSIEDFVAGTIEEHNESVMKCIPDYIVCHDKITDIAIEQQEALNREYKKRNIDKNIEILLIPTNQIYMPRIKSKIEQEYSYVINKLEKNQLTINDFENMFEKKETNIVTRTLQAIHSMSYRDDVWDIVYADDLLRKMTYTLEMTSQIVPPEKTRVVLEQVNLLLERADTTKGFGKRYYDHTYADCIDVRRLTNCRNVLREKNETYENNGPFVKKNNDVIR